MTATQDPPAPTVNDLLASIDVVDPYPLWQALADAGTTVAPDGSGAMLTRHEECGELLRSPKVSSDFRTSTRWRNDVKPHLSEAELARLERNATFLFRDPPIHTRLRKLVSRAFTPRTVERLQPYVEQLAVQLLDEAAARGRLEVVEDIAYPLPVAVISHMLGVPLEDHEVFAGWSATLAAGLEELMTVSSKESAAVRQKATDDFREYFTDLAEQRRREPREDLLSALVAAEDEGDRLSADELVSTAQLLLIAGHETTVNLIGNGTLALLRQPGLLERVKAEPQRINGVVEEVLRLDPPVQLTARTAAEDIELPEGTLRTGATAVLLVAAANRDPAAYPDPLRFDETRSESDDYPQPLSFGGGIHFCIGAPLARLEGRAVLGELARRFTAPELVELVYRENRLLRGPGRLVVKDAAFGG